MKRKVQKTSTLLFLFLVMGETVKNLAIILVMIAFGFLIGYLIYGRQEVEPINVEPEIIENTQKIDSLQNIIHELTLNNEKLKDSIKTVEVIKIVKDNQIENMPIDENVALLTTNLLTYGSHTQETDTFPQLTKVDEDTLVLLSENNVIDINLGYSRLSSLIFINNLQKQIIQNDSLTIDNQVSIINRKDILLEKQKLACQQNTNDLQKQLKKEKVTRICWEVGGIVITGSLITLLILQATK